MKIIILAGGMSPERDVSLSSASQIAKALINKGHEICVIDLYYGINLIENNLIFSTSENDISDYSVPESSPDLDNMKNSFLIGPNIIKCCQKADIVYIALHGDIGENGKIQALLDLYKIKYTGSGYEGCFLSMDKNTAKILVDYNNICTPKWTLNTNNKNLAYPLVIKPSNGGSSIGVSIANNYDEYCKALKKAGRYDKKIIIEEKIDGREFSVGILDNKALPVIEIETLNSGFHDYKNKYQKGFTKETCPADLPNETSSQLQETALKIHNILQLKFYSRIDFIIDNENRIYFLEANSLPGMTPTSLLPQEAAAAGITYDELCNKIVLNTFEQGI